MGGQACVFYGAAEFSRDTDFAILADAANLAAAAHRRSRNCRPNPSPFRLLNRNISGAVTPSIFAASIPKPCKCAWT